MWASFEFGEAQGKICFQERFGKMNPHKWAAKVIGDLHLKSVFTQWLGKTRRLTMNYVKNSGKACMW